MSEMHTARAGRNEDLSGIRRTPSNTIFALKFFAWGLMMGVGFWGSVTMPLPYILPFQILLALGMVHGVELSHQALHGTAFSGRLANRIAGALMGLPMLVSFSAYRASHLHHHRALGTPADREFWDYGDISRISMRALAVHFLILKHYQRAGANIFRAVTFRNDPDLPSRAARYAGTEYRAMAVMILALVAASIAIDPLIFLTGWLLPLVLIAGPVHALVELPEHHGCDRSTPDVFTNTRSITSNRFMTWFTNGNNLHVEHHYQAGLPVESLRTLHERIGPRIVNRDQGYRAFYGRFFAEIFGRTARTA